MAIGSRAFALLPLIVLASTGAASARDRAPAPIFYAGLPQVASAPTSVSDTLYGYGNGKRDEVVLDLRGTIAVDQNDGSELASGLRGSLRPEWLEEETTGAPYQAQGTWYAPAPEPGYSVTGAASAYDKGFGGNPTASGEVFDPAALTAAHPTLPIPSLAQVTDLQSGREIIVRINDRGPFTGSSIVHLSRGAVQALGINTASNRVHLRYLGPAPKRLGAQTELKAPEGRPRFMVQAGAFSSESNARRVQSALDGAGPTQIQTARSLHRVQVGPWKTRGEAEEALRTVRALGFAEARVIAAQ